MEDVSYSLPWQSCPWPAVVQGLVGVGVLIALIGGPGLCLARRSFAVTVTVLWTALWTLLLGLLWRRDGSRAWWWGVFSSLLLLVFYVAVGALRYGTGPLD
jgi:hypothetical protein